MTQTSERYVNPYVGGALLGVVIVAVLFREPPGHGVPQVIRAVCRRGGGMRKRGMLSLWLGSWAAEYVLLFRLMTVYIVFTISEAVLWQIFITMNKVHYSGIISVLAAIVNLVISISLIVAGFGAMGVALGTVIASVLASALAIPIGVCHLLGISLKVVWVNHLSSLLVLLLSLLAASAASFIGHTSIVGAILVAGVLYLAGLGLVSKIIFTEQEKGFIYTLRRGIMERLGLVRAPLP